MAVPVEDLKSLLQSTRPEATLVHVAGSYVVAGAPELATKALSGALPVVTRDELLEHVGGWPVTDSDLERVAAMLSAAVDNRGG
ncbi:hypothetical protein SAMN05216188_126104 [Lentzea xinjiangensis]|uniref:Uncharacterized protein n=1 Tax=Lentzea xinjiangensis TaxID=402600 RepID=A0A1H9VIY2_9PSEU|nr:hypothetical protein [Lentzea xinjiangensis]SES21675.1 hypothetical protein SAMN05216188_126104 [Lentzea xinjiangensis]